MKYLKRKLPAILLTLFLTDALAAIAYNIAAMPHPEVDRTMWALLSPIGLMLVVASVVVVCLVWKTDDIDWK